MPTEPLDLSEPYYAYGAWHIDESLLPEGRGYTVHDFNTQEEAEAFVKKVESDQEELVEEEKTEVTMKSIREKLFTKAYHKGATCPVCGQFTKVYKRPITSTMAHQLLNAVNKFKSEEFHIGDIDTPRSTGGGDFAKLEHWGLVEAVKSEEDGKEVRTSGRWRITEKGLLFANRKSYVDKYAVIYNGRLLRMDGDKVGIIECLGEKFNYAELMKPVGELTQAP